MMDRWKSTSNYMGPDMSEYFALISVSRDSGILQQSNFDAATHEMGIDIEESDTVQIHRFNHWGYGWIDTIMIHESDQVAITKGNDIQEALMEYPVLDDEDYYHRENEYLSEYWVSIDIPERVSLCQEAGACVFSARSDDMPGGVESYIVVE